MTSVVTKVWQMLSDTTAPDAWLPRFVGSVLSPNNFKWQTGVTPLTHLSWPVAAIAVYLFTIFSLQAWMKDRPKYQLKTLGNYHNLLLVYWSAAMVIGTLAEVARLVLLDGYTAYDVMCDNVDGGSLGAALTGRLGFWAWMYYVSKYYELLDTVLMVLRKRPLTLLHVYHHCVIMFATWTWNVAGWTWHWYAIVVNCSVHVVMYSYYYIVSTTGKRPWWKVYITKAQLAQFASVFFLIFVWVYYSISGLRLTSVSPFIDYDSSACSGEPWAVFWAQMMNISFLFLFGSFYVQSYLKPKRSKSKASDSAAASPQADLNGKKPNDKAEQNGSGKTSNGSRRRRTRADSGAEEEES